MERQEIFQQEIKPKTVDLEELKKEVFDKDWLEETDNFTVYFFYKDVYKPEDETLLKENRLRYDIIIVSPKRLGKEFAKTKGHYSPRNKKETYPEIYEVLEGRADFLLQKGGKGRAEKSVVVRAEEGEHVIIPPGFGCVIINTSRSDPLKVSRLVDRNFKEVNDSFEEKGGACYFELIRGFRKNEHYEYVSDLGIYDASKNDLFPKRKIYDLIKKPEIFDFLHKPKEEFFKRLDYY